MNEMFRLILGVIVLFLGIPIGNFLAKITKEELKDGQLWFKLIIIFSSIGAILSLVLKNDFLLFGFLFMAIVTSRSLVFKKKNTSRKTKK
ncbi:MAG: hypothetical protein AABW63_01125 [Nanoarchaeota archaeon]